MKETRFKETEIGLIPEKWELRRIETSFDFVGNNTFARNQMSNVGEVVNIHYGDVLIKYGANVDVSSDSVMFLDTSIRTKAVHALQSGDIVMADTAEDETAGKCCEIIGAENKQVEAGLHTFVLRPKEKYAPKFLGYAFNAESYHNQLVPLMQGTKVTSISKGAVGTTFLICPPLDEQEKIAKALSDVDNLIQNLATLIEKKRAIKQGAMQQLLTGRRRICGFNGRWMKQSIDDTFLMVKDTVNCSEFNSEDYISTENLLQNRAGIVPFKSNLVYEKAIGYKINDILISNIRPYLKKIWFADKNACCSSDVIVFRCKKCVVPQYSYFLLSDDKFFAYMTETAKGTKMPRGDKSSILKYEVLFPEDKDEQLAISDILSDMDKEIKLLQQKRDKYIAIKQGMMQVLLTGKIRLI